MRSSPLVDALFPQIRGKLLSAVFGQPKREWFATELANFLHTRLSSLQREIETLGNVGILAVRREGRRVYVKANPDSPISGDLVSLFEKTTGTIAVLQRELQPLDSHIRLAFVYGSMARSTETAQSDVDLMLVGTIQMSDLVGLLKKSENILGRPVNATIYSVSEFRAKADEHFLRSVLQTSLKFLKGNEHELAAMVGKERTPATPDK